LSVARGGGIGDGGGAAVRCGAEGRRERGRRARLPAVARIDRCSCFVRHRSG